MAKKKRSREKKEREREQLCSRSALEKLDEEEGKTKRKLQRYEGEKRFCSVPL